ncbi:MAG: CRISPR system precrRNA processing endoribonuclease RAMP protein Cas6 [Moorellaceae bacterium]
MWQDIKVLDLEITLVAKEDIRLPFFRENALRSALGSTLLSTMCISPECHACEECAVEGLCAYSRLFFLRRKSFSGGSFSSPYVSFFAPHTPKFLSAGMPFTLYLRLLGSAVSYYPYFYFCLEELARKGIGVRREDGRRGRFVLKRIFAQYPDGRKVAVFFRETGLQSGELRPFTLADHIDSPEVRLLKLKTLSPLRLKYRNRLTDRLEFHVLLRAVLRRISGLYLWTTGRIPGLDYSSLISRAQTITQVENSLSWFDYSRYSTTQGTEMKLGGLVGEVVYQGDLTELYPFIKAGEVLAIGKGTAFGFGRYKVSVEEAKKG